MKGYVYRFKEDWRMTAWLAANIMNVHIVKGPPVTIRRLLGEDFFEQAARPRQAAFASREAWERNKAEIQEAARFHSRVLRSLKAGKRKSKTASVNEIISRSRTQ